jgi:hypothetical protein
MRHCRLYEEEHLLLDEGGGGKKGKKQKEKKAIAVCHDNLCVISYDYE